MEVSRKRKLVLVALIVMAFLSACGQGKPKEVVVCTVGDLSGPVAPYGNDNNQAVLIAADEINAAGGIDGVTVVVKTFDEKNDPVEAVKIAQRAADECVVAIVGSASGGALAAGPYYEEAGVPFVFTVSSNVKATSSGWNYVSRIQLSDYNQIVRLSEYAATELGITKLALLHDTSDFGLGGKDAMIEILEERGDIELVATEGWRVEDVDFSTQILNAERAGAEAIWLIGAAEGSARIVKQAETLGVEVQFFSNTSVGNQKFLDLAAETAEGMIITWGAVDPNNPTVQEIDRQMQERYDRRVDVFVGHAYDAMRIVADAMAKAGTTIEDRPAIQEAIRSGSYDYSLGPLSFDETGHNVRHIYIAEVINGQFEIID
jgi:branched-chain amino acid transport system substrate-binding protein